MKHEERRIIKHTPNNLFNLVADVKKYPEFLPWCLGARIKKPDLKSLFMASETIGKIIKKGDLIIYESTVYPGCIEEESEYKLSDYEYDKENPNWRYGQRQDCVGKWQMKIVPDEEYVKFQESPDL